MKRKSVSVQPDLFEQDRPRVLLVPLTEGAAGSAGRSPVARDRSGTGKREGRQ